MKEYLRNNLAVSFRTSPFTAPLKAWALTPLFMAIAIAVGFGTGLLKLEVLNSKAAFLLPVTLFIFPSLLEETFFRGVLIPRDVLQAGTAKAIWAVVLSTAAFVVWHPLNALAFNHTAIALFLDPWFLLIVSALGLSCGFAYVVSKSIWVPVIIHWVTVLVWVIFLGGRNLVLEF